MNKITVLILMLNMPLAYASEWMDYYEKDDLMTRTEFTNEMNRRDNEQSRLDMIERNNHIYK